MINNLDHIPGTVQQPLSEQSLVGFGSQIAREILNPGSYQREQEASTNTFMARVAEAKAQAKAAETAKQQVNSSLIISHYHHNACQAPGLGKLVVSLITKGGRGIEICIKCDSQEAAVAENRRRLAEEFAKQQQVDVNGNTLPAFTQEVKILA